MTINLIDLATVKVQLGLVADPTYDAQITAMIPIVSSDVRRILNCEFDQEIPADFSVSDATLQAVDGIPMGTVLYHPNFPDNTYIQSFDSNTTFLYTMSETPTGGGDYVGLTINISQQPAISKMIFYKITGQTTADAAKVDYKSKSILGVSKTIADSEINKEYNYPSILINDLGTPYAEVG